MKSRIFLTMLLVVALCIGCASSNKKFVETSYKTLETLTISGNAAISSVEDLWKQGVISDDTARKAKNLYSKYYAIQQTLVVSLAEYTAIDNKAVQEQRRIQIQDALTMLIQLSGEITNLLIEFKVLPDPRGIPGVQMNYDNPT